MRKLVHTEIIPIRWGDMDAAGHVNNAIYFRYMEQARVSWYESMDLNENGAAVAPGSGPVVINTSCTFLRALRYPGDVEVRVFLGELGRASLTTLYEMRPSYDAATIYAEGQAKGCWIDIAKEKSIPLPQPVRALAEAV
jgi:acyl-CoA thioester hydrolase